MRSQIRENSRNAHGKMHVNALISPPPSQSKECCTHTLGPFPVMEQTTRERGKKKWWEEASSLGTVATHAIIPRSQHTNVINSLSGLHHSFPTKKRTWYYYFLFMIIGKNTCMCTARPPLISAAPPQRRTLQGWWSCRSKPLKKIFLKNWESLFFGKVTAAGDPFVWLVESTSVFGEETRVGDLFAQEMSVFQLRNTQD